LAVQDKSGKWAGVMEQIEEAVYGGLTTQDMDELELVPATFPSPAEAIRWGMDQKDDDGQPVFKDEAHAQNAYHLVKETKKPASAQQMRDLWVAEVEARKNGGSTVTPEERQAREAAHAAV
jgi:hypothetical protein